jgi:hypothetical protein
VVVIVGHLGADNGTEEAANDSAIPATHRMADDRAGTAADQCAGEFIRCHRCRTADCDETRDQKARCKYSGFHDVLLRLTTLSA